MEDLHFGLKPDYDSIVNEVDEVTAARKHAPSNYMETPMQSYDEFDMRKSRIEQASSRIRETWSR